MKKGRRNHSASFKAKVALEAVRGEKSLAGSVKNLSQIHPEYPRSGIGFESSPAGLLSNGETHTATTAASFTSLSRSMRI